MLHPQARDLLDLIEKSGLPPTHMLAPVEARKMYRDRRFYTQPTPPEVASVRDASASGPHGAIPLRIYRPFGSAPDAVLPVLVFYHGGGWVIGDLVIIFFIMQAGPINWNMLSPIGIQSH